MPDAAVPTASDPIIERLVDLLSGPTPRWPEAHALADSAIRDNSALRGPIDNIMQMYTALRGPEGTGATPIWSSVTALAQNSRFWAAVLGIAGVIVGAVAIPAPSNLTTDAQEAFRPERIVALQQVTYPKNAYNLGQYKTIQIRPPRQKVVIDGKLSEWDRTTAFRSGCDGTEQSPFRFEGMMMADADNVYVAALVRDPWPLANQMEPVTGRDPQGWRGGAVQVRMATRAGWPLDAGPTDKSDQFAHMTLWHYHPRHESCLHVAFGMDFHGDTTMVSGKGFTGTHRPTTDGRGYVLEYAIPWSVLKAAAPTERREMALSWNVLWSDADGKDWRAKLIDVINPDHRPDEPNTFSFAQASTWGRGVYAPTP